MKVILYMAMSVDGYIAGEHDKTPWSDSEWQRYKQAVNNSGCLIVGKITYEIMKNDDFEVYENLKQIIVVTNNTQDNSEDIVSVSSPKEALSYATEKGFESVIIGGGAMLNKSFLEENLVDEIHVDIEPMMLGEGIAFLQSSDNVNLKKKLVEELDEGVVHIEYEVVK